MSLYEHAAHDHQPVNVNVAHAEEHTRLNDRIAVVLTRSVGNMWTAYSFILLAVIGLCAILGVLSPLVALLVAWLSQTLIQLVLLPVIMVGQNVLNHKQELQSDEQYQFTLKSYHDIKEMMKHLDIQDEELLRQTALIQKLLSKPVTSRKKAVVE